MELVESGLNSEQVSLMRPIYIGKIHFRTKTTSVLITRVVLISSGLYSGTLLYLKCPFLPAYRYVL